MFLEDRKYLTGSFTVFQTQNQEIGECHVVQGRRSRNCSSKIKEGSVGYRIIAVLMTYSFNLYAFMMEGKREEGKLGRKRIRSIHGERKVPSGHFTKFEL